MFGFGGLHRRLFLKILAAAGVVATTETQTGCAPGEEEDAESDESAQTEANTYDFVIVGSGAGGGPLAANLARAGFTVCLIEAGKDDGALKNYEVPAFHPMSTEDPEMRWDFYVKHYSDDRKAQEDSKFTWKLANGELITNAQLKAQGRQRPADAKPHGILYPRAGTLGGCTAHNAMITVYPHESDWEKISLIAKRDNPSDDSWSPQNMRKYYKLLERCEYAAPSGEGHGFNGWLGVTQVNPREAPLDIKLIQIIKAAALAAGRGLFGDISELVGARSRDMNENGRARDSREGLVAIPLAISKKGPFGNNRTPKRNGPREFILDTVRKGHPLKIEYGALATRVLFADEPGPDGQPKAAAVEFMQNTDRNQPKSFYAADPKARRDNAGVKRKAFAKREVIVAGGAYNTPQLLKLSGIGPREELERFDIQPVTVSGRKLPIIERNGVGTNLQDRYEVGVVSEVKDDFRALSQCTFGKGNDPCLNQWQNGTGPYVTNGAPFGVMKKSSVAEGDCDLIIFGAPGAFRGYSPKYAEETIADKKHFTWAVLKAHTRNRAGTVTLRSADPRDVPEINFKYFEDGRGGSEAEKDLQAMVEGVKFAREIGRHAGNLMLDDVPLFGGKYEEQWPGPQNRDGNNAQRDDQLTKEFVKREAWGHHASCTCPMGADDDPMAVLDTNFNVRGTAGLRVVDASVFPYIPGVFIVVPIYMISEKATDVILKDAGGRRMGT